MKAMDSVQEKAEQGKAQAADDINERVLFFDSDEEPMTFHRLRDMQTEAEWLLAGILEAARDYRERLTCELEPTMLLIIAGLEKAEKRVSEMYPYFDHNGREVY